MNPSGTKWAYRYRAYDLHIPKGLVKKAHKNGKTDQWVSFQFASRSAIHRTEADSLLNGGIVRRARCKLPPSRKIHMKVKKQLIKFGKRSWAYQNQKPQTTNTDDNISPVRTSINATCTAYWVYRLYDGNTLVYQEILGCSKWSYSGGGDDSGGSGGGSSGGNDSDPCSPNASGGIPVIGCSDPKPPDCAGVPGGTAYKDACGICVGGTTGKVSCCASLQNIISRVIGDEGSTYTNNPKDDGGPTKYGITKNTWHLYAKDVLGIDPGNVSVQSITEQEARTIYRKVYGPWSKVDAVSALDGDLGIFYYNMFVITPGGAVRSLQKNLRSLGYSVSVDGGMGGETLSAIKDAIQDNSLVDLYNNYKKSMKAYWQKRVDKDPDNATFKKGWDNRTERFADKTSENKRNVNCN